MIPAKLDDATVEHINRLKKEGISESKTLEFKRDVPGRDNSAKHEFLSDVCALANAAGGDIIFGIDENNEGEATEIVGQAVNPDDECLRLQDVVLHGLEPKLTGVHAHAIKVEEGKYVFILRVPQSWTPPHRVKTNQHFFIREGRRKRQLDMPEIRTAVIQSESLRERVRAFRADRIGKLISGEAPVALFNGSIEVLHIVPISSLFSGQTVDVLAYDKSSRCIPVISGGAGIYCRINLDGVLNCRNNTPQGCGAYTQIFRDGTIEGTRVFTQKGTGLYQIVTLKLEHELLDFFERVKEELKFLEIQPPFILMHTLLRANEAEFYIPDRWNHEDYHGRFNRAIIALPELIIEDLDISTETLLKPMFDLIWNAAGFPRSENYDENGKWKNRQ
ncbi:MAG: helix-turn-helix domain-containing protein [Candidatus Methylumidiphilus sp.]